MFHLVNLKSGSKYELRVSYPATVSKTDAFLSTFCSLARAWEGGRGTPQNFGWGCAARFSKPDPISDRNMIFQTPFQT